MTTFKMEIDMAIKRREIEEALARLAQPMKRRPRPWWKKFVMWVRK